MALIMDDKMTINEISEKLRELKQSIFDRLSDIGEIQVPYGMKLDSIYIPLLEVTEISSKGKKYIIGVPQFESEIVFPKTILEDLK